MVTSQELKNECRLILEEEKVKYIVGYKQGTHGILAAPVFITDPDQVEQLIWNPACVHNLCRFLIDEKRNLVRQKNPDTRPIGIVAKGCDSRALNVLLQEKYISRESVYIIGVSCENTGMVDEKKLRHYLNGKPISHLKFTDKDQFSVYSSQQEQKIQAQEIMANRCLECQAKYPLNADIILGEKIDQQPDNPYESVDKMESLPSEERWLFWQENFDKCIRCYACRSICPMCYCEECVVDSIRYAVTADTSAKEKAQKIKWIERSSTRSENCMYHLVRAMHLAGRCIDCGECERVCPVNIPIRLLNKKLEKDAKELFNYDAGFDPHQPSLVSSFNDQDPEDFIR